jgi:hypothetical protein
MQPPSAAQPPKWRTINATADATFLATPDTAADTAADAAADAASHAASRSSLRSLPLSLHLANGCSQWMNGCNCRWMQPPMDATSECSTAAHVAADRCNGRRSLQPSMGRGITTAMVQQHDGVGCWSSLSSSRRIYHWLILVGRFGKMMQEHRIANCYFLYCLVDIN